MAKRQSTELKHLVEKAPVNIRAKMKAILATLKPLGVKSLDSLVDILRDQKLNLTLRLNACWVLGQFNDARATEVLLATISGEDAILSLEAAKALCWTKDKQVIRTLLSLLSDGRHNHSRIASAYLLGVIGEKRALKPLIAVLDDINGNAQLRAYAAEALGNIGDKRAMKPLIAALNDCSIEVKISAVYALGEIGDLRVVPKLEELAKSNDAETDILTIRKEATRAVKRILKRHKLLHQSR